MKVSDLIPNVNNPRKITDEKLKMLAASIENFGDLSGIVFNRKSHTLVGGHQRTKLFRADQDITITRTLKKPNRQGTCREGFIVVEGETHKYREVDWDELTEKAANLAANTHGGEWDSEKRKEWLLYLDKNNYPIEITGTNKEETENILAPQFYPEKELDENLTTEKECPSCGYKW